MFGFLILISWTSKDILHLELKLKAYMDMMLFLPRWPEWDPCRGRVRGYRDCGLEFPSADASRSVDGMRKRPMTSPRPSYEGADFVRVEDEVSAAAAEKAKQIYLPKWNVINDSVLDDLEASCNMVDQLAPQREGVLKDININTLDLENNDKQVRNTRHRITSCKARIKVDLHPIFEKYEITKFVSKNNHQMILKHYQHLTKKQRKMTQSENMFVVKASTMKLGATRTHNLYSSMKGGAQYVHGMSDDFKNHIRDVNAFIGESDAQ
nr:hypothetical protein [Tanacetum cinerariifolium]